MLIFMPGYLQVLDRVFILTSLAGCLSWIGEYTWNRGWRNSMGRTLLTKTSLLAGLLALSALNIFLSPDPFWELVLTWTGLVLLAAIGPVMVWRMLVFRRASKAVRFCANGHQVLITARYCPRCGVLLAAPISPAEDEA